MFSFAWRNFGHCAGQNGCKLFFGLFVLQENHAQLDLIRSRRSGYPRPDGGYPPPAQQGPRRQPGAVARLPLMTTLQRLIVAAVLAAASPHLAAQAGAPPAYPSRTIRMVVPYPPGAGTDLHARALAQKMTEALGQQVIVDNRSGANGIPAMELVAKSAPDGYTIVYALPAQYAVNPAVYPRLPYDPVRDFDPIMLVVRTPLVLFAHPSVPVKSVKELVQLAKTKGGDLTLASAGNGSAGHLCLEMFRLMTGTRILHVPYKGAAPSMVDLIAGHAQLSFLAWSTAGGYVKVGKLRALGVTSAKRAVALPDLPAIAETLPGYDISNWYGAAGPKGMPGAVITRLNAEIKRALNTSELRQGFEREAIEPIGGTPEEFGAYIKSEMVKWGKLVKASGLKVD
jgi:tripartite-type tricarboxylate transporter receptor subunit TctC